MGEQTADLFKQKGFCCSEAMNLLGRIKFARDRALGVYEWLFAPPSKVAPATMYARAKLSKPRVSDKHPL